MEKREGPSDPCGFEEERGKRGSRDSVERGSSLSFYKYRWSLTYRDLIYDFSTLQWCTSNMHTSSFELGSGDTCVV